MDRLPTATPSASHAKRRRLSPTTSPSSPAGPPDPPHRWGFHRSLQEGALSEMLELHAESGDLEATLFRLDEEVDELQREAEEQLERSKEHSSMVQKSLDDTRDVMALTAITSRDMTTLGNDASTLTNRFVDLVRNDILPFFAVQRDTSPPRSLLVLPVEQHDRLLETVDDCMSSTLLDGIFTGVQLNEEVVQHAQEHLDNLAAAPDLTDSTRALLDSWKEVAAAFSNDEYWPVRPAQKADWFASCSREIKAVKVAWKAGGVEPGDLVLLHYSDDVDSGWVYGYRLDGQETDAQLLPLAHLDPATVLQSSPSDPPLPKASLADQPPALSSPLVDSTARFRRYRLLLANIITAVAVHQLRQMNRLTDRITALQAASRQLVARGADNTAKRLKLQQNTEAKLRELAPVRKRLPKVQERLYEQVLMLVVLSRRS
ncbi:hypothetical protein JCM10213_006789 [Rhodosporidiobolus nylandii]